MDIEPQLPRQAPQRSAALGHGLAVGAGFFWATGTIIGKFLVATGADPVLLVGVRSALAFLLLGAALAAAARGRLSLRARDVPFLLTYGACLAATGGLYFVALKFIPATMAVVLCNTYPAILTGLAALFLGERLTGVKVTALALTLTGCFLVVQGYAPQVLRLNLPGVLCGLGNALGVAVYALLTKRAVGSRCDAWSLVLWGFGFGSVFLLAARVTHLGEMVRFSGPVWGGVVLAAVFPAIVGYSLFNTALTRIEASRAGLSASIEPVVAAALAWLILGERLEPLQWLGAASVLAGVFLVQAAALGRGGT